MDVEPCLSWALVLCEVGTACCNILGKTVGLCDSSFCLSVWLDLESPRRLSRHTSRCGCQGIPERERERPSDMPQKASHSRMAGVDSDAQRIEQTCSPINTRVKMEVGRGREKVVNVCLLECCRFLRAN